MRKAMLLLVLLSGCSSGNDAKVDAGASCAAVGGACVIGPAQQNCAGTVDADIDCNPDRNPGGAVCCVPCPAGQQFFDGGCFPIRAG